MTSVALNLDGPRPGRDAPHGRLDLWLVRWVADRSDADLAFESTGDGQVVQVRFERVEETAGGAQIDGGND